MKLCVFQGTFNPVHKAHLRLVDFVLKNFDFDKILVIPAFKPPHKDYDIKMSFHRLNMCRIAFKNFDKVEVSDIEFQRGEKSYTYVTIRELYKKFEIEGKINFITGTDAFENIENWYEAEKLKKLVKFIVFKREEKFSALKYNHLKDRGYNFEIQTLDFENISSSNLRELIKNNESTINYLPSEIKEYIEKNDLYKS